METKPLPGPVLLYDGVCALCNWWVKFVLKRDKSGRFRFAALQSETAQKLLAPTGRSAEALDSIVLIEADAVRSKSDAALRVLELLDSPWRRLAVLRKLPRRLRDMVYDLVAVARYRIFGKYEACPLPPEEYRARFLSS